MAEGIVSGTNFASFADALTKDAIGSGNEFFSFDTTLGGGSGDTTAPLVVYVNPNPGAQIRTDTAITINVTDDSGGFAGIQLRVQYRSAVPKLPTETIHGGDELGVFEPFYESSTVTTITDGFQFVLRRDEGWPSTPSFVASPIDPSGNTAP